MKNYILRVKNSNGWVRVRKVQLSEVRYKEFVKNLNKDVRGYTLLEIFEL